MFYNQKKIFIASALQWKMFLTQHKTFMSVFVHTYVDNTRSMAH